MIISVTDKIENIVGKGELACTRNFSYLTMFSRGFFPRPIKRCHSVGMGLYLSKIRSLTTQQHFGLDKFESIDFVDEKNYRTFINKYYL